MRPAPQTRASPSKVKIAVTKVRADDDQQALLNAHASLNAKAIERVDVPTARANPTITSC